MSTAYYARKIKPRKVYDEYQIGTTRSGDFYLAYDEKELHFPDIYSLVDFIKTTQAFKFYNEYNEEIAPEEMVKIVQANSYNEEYGEEDDDWDEESFEIN